MSHISLLDDNSRPRRSLLRHYFSNNLELLEFYHSVSRWTKIPIIGNLILKDIINFYGYNYHTGMALPLREVLDLLEQASFIAVAQCACRTLRRNCQRPLMTCLYINTGGKIYLDKGTLAREEIDKERAKAIVEESVRNEMLLALEWCLPPFSYAICSCCPCCCLTRKLRFTYGIEAALQAGPFYPWRREERCVSCGSCQDLCPAKALTLVDHHWQWREESCLGCGLCREKCPAEAIEMLPRRGGPQRKKPPGLLKKGLLWLGAMTILYPSAYIFAQIRNQRRTLPYQPPKTGGKMRTDTSAGDSLSETKG